MVQASYSVEAVAAKIQVYRESGRAGFIGSPRLDLIHVQKMSLVENFDRAADEAKQLKAASNEEKLTLYKFFKQVSGAQCFG